MPQLLIDLKRCVPADIAGAACPIAAEDVGTKILHKLAILVEIHISCKALMCIRKKSLAQTAFV